MNAAWTAASEEMYKAQEGAGKWAARKCQQQPHEEGAGANANENVTDAEFEEVK